MPLTPQKPEPRSPSLLSPGGYDDDVSSLRSASEQDSDTEDDEFLQGTRTTLELAEHDRKVLEDEEELEKLLTKRGPTQGLRRIFSPGGSSVKIGKKERRQRRREMKAAYRRRHERPDEEGELMHEMEEGYRDDESSGLNTPSSDGEGELLDGFEYKQSKGDLVRKLLVVFSAIAVLFLILLLGAYKASSNFRVSHRPKPLISNGTALFAPTTILISLDGFRADFLNRGLTPTLNDFIAEGVSPKYMLPSFPSVTFPNHYTLVTGLYPESHGVVGNSFWDSEFQEEFHTESSVSTQSKWWNSAEPLWVTAEKQGVHAAIHMWPGSEAHVRDIDPTFYDRYNGSETLPRKVDRVLEYLDLPGEETESYDGDKRPQFIAAYVPDVDRDGHRFGPNSTEIRATITEADDMLARLFQGIRDRNLTNIVNIVVVSDHGMATTSNERLVQLEDLVDISLVEHIDGWPSRGLRPKRPEDLPVLQEQLEKAKADYADKVEIYSRETMPERYHFSNNERIAPLWVIPKTGWAVVERPEFDAKKALETGEVYRPRGIHGYDHEHPLMRAIFIARGPAFPHPSNSRLEVFQVYNIICDSLGVKSLPNNGTLHLPLQPVGLHSDEEVPAIESPPDPPVSSSVNSTAEMMPVPRPTSPAVHTSDTAGEQSSKVDGGEEQGDEEEDLGVIDDNNDAASQPKTWWGTMMDKLESFKEWAGEFIQSKTDNEAPK
ncbi:Type I phosphodiesterase / nucleotide pyrophosphatase family protein [Paecilomyces variotii No. 5]|uniref:Type I phosphodiesterase / nucleotide pyrophosphatase family protein n=1 Tax=Byssochlamys spectabilis (strain No. 5 / NBRC 109023) TaxID=1356009 RepID=V5FNX3_BYSSN|nr:Type I phosphodiesterase / nucleotide pyrophosphatase family protein [Paecilomyces variotii No. 5]